MKAENTLSVMWATNGQFPIIGHKDIKLLLKTKTFLQKKEADLLLRQPYIIFIFN